MLDKHTAFEGVDILIGQKNVWTEGEDFRVAFVIIFTASWWTSCRFVAWMVSDEELLYEAEDQGGVSAWGGPGPLQRECSQTWGPRAFRDA